MASVLGVVCLIVGALVLGIGADKGSLRRGVGPLVSMGLAMSLVQYAAVRIGVVNISAMLGALAGLIVGGLWALWRARRTTGAESTPAISGAMLLRVLPYLMLIAIIMIVNFVPALSAALNHIKIVFDIPARSLADGTTPSAGQDTDDLGLRSSWSATHIRRRDRGAARHTPWQPSAGEWRQNPGRCAPEWNAVDVGDLDDDGYGHHDAGLRNGIRAGKCDGSPCRAALPSRSPLHWGVGSLYDRKQHQRQRIDGGLTA